MDGWERVCSLFTVHLAIELILLTLTYIAGTGYTHKRSHIAEGQTKMARNPFNHFKNS